MANKATSKLLRIVILCKEIDETAVLYTYCLGLRIHLQGPKYLELVDESNQRLVFYAVPSIAQQSKGYSPMLQFRVDDFNVTLENLKLYGAKLESSSEDGGIKVAVLQGINGEMLSIMSGEEDHENAEKQEDEDDAVTQSIKDILKRLQL